jgi:hypothetical protein
MVRKINENSSLKEVALMVASSHSYFNFPESVVLRWILKAFLLGLFVGAIAAINALINR